MLDQAILAAPLPSPAAVATRKASNSDYVPLLSSKNDVGLNLGRQLGSVSLMFPCWLPPCAFGCHATAWLDGTATSD